ncbi:hypothetical protein [Nocardioides sp. YIM 152588]|uniref:hypothetical protein n=1 Tax=Nocardioides sp. YIM 152588 TaxID=3158259 RepID=UPI0032E41FDA
MLATLLALPVDAVAGGEAVLVVAGIGASTFIAHLFADIVGSQVESADTPDDVPPFRMLRDSLPILSATAVPLLILLAARWDVLGPTLALRAAELFCIARIGLTGVFVSRYLRRPVTRSTWITCVGTAAGGMLVVAIKISLGHG